MRMRVVWIAVLALCGVIAAGGASAHHSAAMFDRSKVVTLDGVVKEYLFEEPHSWISIMVTDPAGGEPVRWDLEGGSVSRMRDAGFTPDNLKVGDKVKARAFPLRDGRHGGALIDITFPDGRTYTNNVTKLQVGQ
jgi:hypothetical protein